MHATTRTDPDGKFIPVIVTNDINGTPVTFENPAASRADEDEAIARAEEDLKTITVALALRLADQGYGPGKPTWDVTVKNEDDEIVAQFQVFAEDHKEASTLAVSHHPDQPSYRIRRAGR